MRFTIAYTLLFAGIAAGCGAVDNGVCPGEQDDNVECTVDVCNAGGSAWAHIPDHTLCGAGMRCDPTAGCVAAGGLTGRALLFGHTDHSGITVSVDGVEGASTTTDAAGAWTLTGIPAGTHTITYSKETWITETAPGVGVLPEAATSPALVELRRGREANQNSVTYFSGEGGWFLSPDGKYGVSRTYTLIGAYGYYAYDLEAPGAPVTLIDQDLNGQFEERNLANTHFLYRSLNGDTVWSKPLAGGPAVVLGTAIPGETIYIEGIGGEYAILRKQRSVGYVEHSLWVVKVDGSQVLTGAPFYVTPDSTHTYAGLAMNDTTAVVLLSNNSNGNGTPADGQANTPMRRVDLATGTVTNVNTGFATTRAHLLSVSPDRNYIYGYLNQGNVWFRGFLMPISGTAAPTLAPDYGAPAGPRFSDYPNNVNTTRWFADGSGVVFQTVPYSLSIGGTAEGGLKVWHTNQPQSTLLVASGSYALNTWFPVHKTVVYRDNGLAYAPLRVVSAHSTSPVSYPLDTDGNNIIIEATDTQSETAGYMVWTQTVAPNNGTRAKIFAVNLTQPLIAAPSKTQLGGTLAATCEYEGVLSDTTYWQLCRDTGVLSGFAASTTTPGATTTDVRAGLRALPEADRVAYRRYDGKLYSSPNTGTLSDVTLISAMWDPQYDLRASDSWVFFRDSDGDFLRVSNADGSAIDEPLSECNYDTYWGGGLNKFVRSPGSDHVWFATLNCGSPGFADFWVPTANLP